MIDILLVNPAEKGGFFEKMPPQGLASIASFLEEHDISVKIVDFEIEEKPLEHWLSLYQPKFLGISGTTHTRFESIRIAQEAKNFNKDIIIIYGGIHATLVQPFNKQAEEFVLRDEEIEKCKETLLKAQTKAESLGLYHTFNAVMEGLERKSTIKNSNSKNREHYNSFISTYCFEPFLSLTISAEGKVSPCCMFWKDENPSVLEHTLNEIWNGSFFRDIRNRLITGDIPDICMNCPSQLRQRSENIRIELQKMGEKTANTPLALLVRFINRLRKEGLYSALRRVKEWLYIKTGKL